MEWFLLDMSSNITGFSTSQRFGNSGSVLTCYVRGGREGALTSWYRSWLFYRVSQLNQTSRHTREVVFIVGGPVKCFTGANEKYLR